MANWLTSSTAVNFRLAARGSFSATDGLGLMDERQTLGGIKFAIVSA